VLRACVVAVVLLSAVQLWRGVDVWILVRDDAQLMLASHRIAAGNWYEIFAPQDEHFQPLYRLARLWFDQRFPDRYAGLHGAIVAAHAAAVWLLFLVARRYTRSPWAALATAAFFGWSSVGLHAFVWKAASHFILAWPFLLGALYTLGRGWVVASLACQLAAVGIFTGSTAVLPGILLGYWRLEGGRDRRALAACAASLAGGLTSWVLFVRPLLDPQRHLPGGAWGLLRQSGEALAAALHTYAILGARAVGLEGEAAAWWLTIPLALTFIAAGPRLSLRWPAVGASFSLVLLFVIYLGRRFEGAEYAPRYAYQSYVFWAIAAGCAVDVWIEAVRSRPALRRALALFLLAAAGFYYGRHWQVVNEQRRIWRQGEETHPEFWRAWSAFFRQAAPQGLVLTRLVFPADRVWERYSAPLLYRLMYRQGLPGIAIARGAGTPEEEYRFWRAVAADPTVTAETLLPVAPRRLAGRLEQEFRSQPLSWREVEPGLITAQLPAGNPWLRLVVTGPENAQISIAGRRTYRLRLRRSAHWWLPVGQQGGELRLRFDATHPARIEKLEAGVLSGSG
jgi:hypothetical protein